MDERSTTEAERFVVEYIDSVPHLEALLLLWRSHPRRWSLAELTSALYLLPRSAEVIAQELTRAGFLTATEDHYAYAPDGDIQDRLIRQVDDVYRRETVRISTMIHARGSRALRDFAESFQLKKKKEQ
jgi:hypothetical protein